MHSLILDASMQSLLPAGILLVDNAAISGSVKDIFEHCRTVLEPAGAVAVAGAKAYLKARPHLKVGAA